MSSRMSPRTDSITEAVEEIRADFRPLKAGTDLDPLVDAVGDANYVLIGEASHGTSEFYRWRARLTARLLREGEFSFVAVEGDWTDCYEVNRFVKGYRDDEPRAVLGEFDRWPTWMWANWEILEFVEWLREYNRNREKSVGLYGLDVYSLFESMAAVVDYLEDYDPEAAERARDVYRCFEPYGEDAREYARSTRLVPESCEDEVVDILAELRRGAPVDEAESEAAFSAEQNALVAKNAEEYYRSMARGGAQSWNVRDRHMVETLERLREHYEGGKAIVWAHNTHVGDARATDMTDRGEVNVGQLVRENHGPDDVAIVGFGTHRGDVIAGEEWEAPMERMRVPPAREGSYGDVFSRAEVGDGFLVLDEMPETDALSERRGQRAIGVVYHPERELGNYVPTNLVDRYDAFIHVEETTALHPLGVEPGGETPPEAYPWGV